MRGKRTTFQESLLAWYRAAARPLPWRKHPSTYRTVVSEFMLQQTKVATVLPYFERWMTTLPDFKSLADASGEKVLKLWEGLGYYSRARNLHRLARELVARRRMPRTPEEWLELPGVGPYTAAAITSIAFDAPAACVDGNVVRILARLEADTTRFRDGVSAARHFQPIASALLNRADPGGHNQAMMELGATLCTRQSPRCEQCPVRCHCAASGPRAESYPRIAAKRTERLWIVRVWCVRNGSLLLHRAPGASRRLAGQYEIPTAGQLGVTDASARTGKLLATRKRSITNHRITESIHAGHLRNGRPPPGLAWVPISGLDAITLSGPHRRWIGELLGGSV